MSDSHVRRRTDQQQPHEPQQPFRALVVEDNEPYRYYVAALARRYGFNVTTACDGAEALDVLRHRVFDLLVVDCEMPVVDGLELIVQARAEEHHGDTYAVMLTGRDDLDTKLAALRLGYDDFLPKSASEPEIAAKLGVARRHVAHHRRLDDAVRELHGLANRDELTALFNRRYFFAEAERLLLEDVAVNLVLFDLDDFKRINDTHGHLAGDRVLRDIGALFHGRTRHDDLVARYGGDEFVMLVRNLEPAEIETLAERVVREIEEVRWTIGDETFGTRISTGMACSRLLEKPSVLQLIGACDRDLYKNKWLRKNPDRDPSLYSYDGLRDGRVVEIITMTDHAARKLEA